MRISTNSGSKPTDQAFSRAISAAGNSQVASGRGSFFADLLQKATNLVKPAGSASVAAGEVSGLSPSGSAAKYNAFRSGLTKQLDEIGQRIVQALTDSGIDLSQDLTLRTDAFGGIRADQHSQYADIERVFEENTELRSLVQIAAANRSFLDGQGHSLNDFSVTLNDGELRFEFR